MATTPVDFAKLIPELSLWNNGAGIGVRSWVGCAGNFELAIGYIALFWPDFVEFDDCVFFSDFSEKSYLAFKEKSGGNRRRVETVMNHRHIFDYFSHGGGKCSTEQILYLGRTLKKMWEIKLAADFPKRRFVVSFPEGPYDDLQDYEVSFWQAPD